jgi:hypothetical protein
MALVSVLAVGPGAVTYLAQNSVLMRYFSDWVLLITNYQGPLLAGAAWLLAPLPTLAAFLIRPVVFEHA